MWKRMWKGLLACVCALGLAGLGAPASAAVPVGAEAWALELLRSGTQGVCRAPGGAGSCAPHAVERQQLEGGLVHYRWRVRVGPGEHDFIRLHRVVLERAPGVPRAARASVFMVHGDTWGFEPVFLSPRPSGTEPAALFLARQGVDVWGVDLRWVLVPVQVQDFSFMRDWTLGTHVEDVRQGLAVARWVRRHSLGQGGRMPLLGWSRGAVVAYASANAETQLPPGRRHVGALIPVDSAFKLGAEGEESRQGACQRYQVLEALRRAGQYEGGMLGPGPGLLVQALGQGALLAPEAASPLFPGLNNRQAALLAGSATHLLQSPSPVPGYHFHGGVFSGPLPAGLQWTPEEDFLQFTLQSSPYQSLNEVVETEAILCDDPQLTGGGQDTVPYDDHLRQISVPVLYLGAAGGFGAEGTHTLGLLGSAQVDVHLVELLPPQARALDFGHGDLWLAPLAQQRVWEPLLRWLRAH